MTLVRLIRSTALLCGLLGALQLPASAESLASSAASAGSAASGSVSDSLQGSSHSSSGGDRVATGDYRIIDLAQAPERPDRVRLTLQAEATGERLLLELPQAVTQAEGLQAQHRVHAQQREYGYEFSHSHNRALFYLVLADHWQQALPARPVAL